MVEHCSPLTASPTPPPPPHPEAYQEKGALSPVTEKVTESYVDCAMTVHQRALSVPEVRAIVFEAEDRFGVNTPFDSLYKIESIIKRAKSAENIHYVCDYIYSNFQQEQLTTISVRDLTGKGHGGKGLVDLALFKRDLLQQPICRAPR